MGKGQIPSPTVLLAPIGFQERLELAGWALKRLDEMIHKLGQAEGLSVPVQLVEKQRAVVLVDGFVLLLR